MLRNVEEHEVKRLSNSTKIGWCNSIFKDFQPGVFIGITYDHDSFKSFSIIHRAKWYWVKRSQIENDRFKGSRCHLSCWNSRCSLYRHRTGQTISDRQKFWSDMCDSGECLYGLNFMSQQLHPHYRFTRRKCFTMF